MGQCWGAGVAVALTLVALTTATSAVAATEVGNDCLANGYASDFTLLQLESAAGSALPIKAPSSGVVTQWKVKSGLSIVLAENLRVFRPTGNPNEFRAVANSSSQPVAPGVNVFQARIPVLAGDRFGAFAASPSGALYCSPTNPADVMGAVHFDAGVGSTQTYATNPNFQVALSATVEADKDGDGYGDETQDRCPQSDAYQGACPRVNLALTADVKEPAILVRVVASSEASVRVFGQAGWNMHSRGGSPGKSGKRLVVGLNGGVKRVKGNAARYTFRVPLPRPLLRHLDHLATGKSVKAKIAARSIDLAGRVKVKRIVVKLRGRARA